MIPIFTLHYYSSLFKNIMSNFLKRDYYKCWKITNIYIISQFTLIINRKDTWHQRIFCQEKKTSKGYLTEACLYTWHNIRPYYNNISFCPFLQTQSNIMWFKWNTEEEASIFSTPISWQEIYPYYVLKYLLFLFISNINNKMFNKVGK